MNLSLQNLNTREEKIYFAILMLLSATVWAGVPYWLWASKNLKLLWVYLPFAAFFAFISWLGNGLIVAYLRSNCVRIDADQLPRLHAALGDVCARLNVRPPELFVLQSNGFLNAFAIRHSGRDFVVLYSQFIEELDLAGDEMRFILGHELGHLKSKHIFKQILLMPSAWLPLIGPAYHRACEASCDRYGAFCTQNIDGAVKALAILASGRKLVTEINLASFAEQYEKYRGFFVSWHELISNYPTLSQRVGAMLALKSGVPQHAGLRNPLSYLFAFVSFGGGAGGASPFLAIAVVALLAAIAIPNLLRARISANDALAKATVQAVATASDSYAVVHGGEYPASENDLIDAKPPFLTHSYCGKTISGFTYICRFSAKAYDIIAEPVDRGTTGSSAFRKASAGDVNSRDTEAVNVNRGEVSPEKKKLMEELGLPLEVNSSMDPNQD